MTQQQPRVIGNGFPGGNSRRDAPEENLSKRSQVTEEPATTPPSFTVSSILTSANPQTLEEIAFLLKLVVGVLLSGYLFAWIYFVIPAWKSRRLQAQSPVLVQDVKA